MAAGAVDFVTKPLDWDFLADRVKHVLRHNADDNIRDGLTAVSSHHDTEAAQSDSAALLEKDNEIAVLRAALVDSERKVSALTQEQQNAAEREATPDSKADWSDLQDQVGEIEKEWSIRLRDAVTQANKRADQRYEKLKSRFDD